MPDTVLPGGALRTVAAQALTLASANRLDLVAQTLDDVQQRETRAFFEAHLPLLQHCVHLNQVKLLESSLREQSPPALKLKD